MYTVSTLSVKQNVFPMAITKTKDITHHTHDRWGTAVCQAAHVPVEEQTVGFTVIKVIRANFAKTGYNYPWKLISYNATAKSRVTKLSDYNKTRMTAFSPVSRPKPLVFLDSYHEVGFGKVFKNHSWKIEGCLRKKKVTVTQTSWYRIPYSQYTYITQMSARQVRTQAGFKSRSDSSSETQGQVRGKV